MTALRIRQVVIAVEDLAASAEVAGRVGLPFVYEDPGVGAFGAVNSLHAVGDSFVELLAEKDEGSPVGRHLARNGGDGGYMVIVQVDDLDTHLRLVAEAGVRLVWQGGRDGIRGAHLHPVDVGAAILSLDEVEPADAWPWCGPDWTGGSPDTDGEPIDGISLAVDDPAGAAARWAQVLASTVDDDGGVPVVRLGSGTIRFEPRADGVERMTEIHAPGLGDHRLGGVRLHG